MSYRVQILEGRSKASQDVAERVGGWTIRLRPTRRQLNAGDGLVCGADSDTLAAPIAIIAVRAFVATAAGGVGALTSAHAVQL